MKKTKRLGATVPITLYEDFKRYVVRIYGFEKGYTKKACIRAFKNWIWILKELDKYKQELIYIGNRDYGHIEDLTERRRVMVKDALYEFIEKRMKED